jgi:hypothetical protein
MVAAAVAVGVTGAAAVLNGPKEYGTEGVPPASVDVVETVCDCPELNPVN